MDCVVHSMEDISEATAVVADQYDEDVSSHTDEGLTTTAEDVASCSVEEDGESHPF